MDRIEPSTHRHYYRSSRENAVPDSTAHLSSSPSNSYDTTAGNQDSSALSTSASRLPAPTYRRQPQTRKHLRNQNRFRLPARHLQHRLGLKLNQQRYHRNRRLRVSGGGKYRQPVTYSRGRPSSLQEPQQPVWSLSRVSIFLNFNSLHSSPICGECQTQSAWVLKLPKNRLGKTIQSIPHNLFVSFKFQFS